mgnify:CR=1 FL=1
MTTSRSKIVATMGPACSSKEVLKQMIIEGVDVCRLNFSHGTHDDHLNFIKLIREINNELGIHTAIMADMQGPKLRIGNIENNALQLNQDDLIHFVSEDCLGTKEKIFMSYKQLPQDVNPGDIILVDDGKIKLQVVETNRKDKVTLKVLFGGILSSKKGVNLPDTKIALPSLTEKDRQDAIFALQQDVDYIALSFVRTATDIIDLRELIKKEKKNAGIIAKIEKPEALREIDEIIDATTAIMVARGDLGVEVAFDQVPMIQKNIIQRCLACSRPVIVATQMMESMITNFRPTRAEATDVANAVLDGADALMLSGETSTGRDPVQVIRAMQQIITHTENHGYSFYRNKPPVDFTPTFFPDSICYTATVLAKQTNAAGIITFTHSGLSAIRLSAQRPSARIFAFTGNITLIPKLSLMWGVTPLFFDEQKNIETAIEQSIAILRKKEFVKDNDILVHVGSIPQNLKGRANMIRITHL